MRTTTPAHTPTTPAQEPMTTPRQEQRKRTSPSEDEGGKRRKAGSKAFYQMTAMLGQVIESILNPYLPQIKWVERYVQAERTESSANVLQVAIAVTHALHKEKGEHWMEENWQAAVRDRLTFRRTLSPWYWSLTLGVDTLDMPTKTGRVFRYLSTKNLDPETALYTLLVVETEQESYLLLLCKKHVYKGVWRESPASVQWFAFVTPKGNTARKMERACSRMYAGWKQDMLFHTSKQKLRRTPA